MVEHSMYSESVLRMTPPAVRAPRSTFIPRMGHKSRNWTTTFWNATNASRSLDKNALCRVYFCAFVYFLGGGRRAHLNHFPIRRARWLVARGHCHSLGQWCHLSMRNCLKCIYRYQLGFKDGFLCENKSVINCY